MAKGTGGDGTAVAFVVMRYQYDMVEAPSNFIRAIIEQGLANGAYDGRVATRFPPEPNGYLHIGHAKSICLNFGLARDLGGICHLRFDDTNPLTESTEYVEAIQRDIRWLGFDWGQNLFFASDYFERLYQFAEELILAGKAYVCSLSDEQVKEYRGTITEGGRPSPDRNRPIAESLDLFRRMKDGEFKDGELVLRAKISLDAANMKMRDPAIYRIRHAHHHRTGDKWCIYPLYDFTHCLSDSIEHITHSICTLEFENNRELYDWFLANLDAPFPSKQYEFAALNLTYTITSKRKLRELVESGRVRGWDDPRLPTLSGLRRGGYTPSAIRSFCDRIGVAKNNSTVDLALLEFTLREELNKVAPRVLAVLDPLKVVITTLPELHLEQIDAPYFPDDVGGEGSRDVPFTRDLYIERDDFQEEPEAKFKRLAPGREVRLRHSYVIRCDEVIKDDKGNVVELRCSHDPDTLSGPPKDGRRIPGTIHWVSASRGVKVEVRLYDRLFSIEQPGQQEADYKTFLNPNSLRVLSAWVEPSVQSGDKSTRYQFERTGFFWQDPEDSKLLALVFNRIVSLKDSWAKVVQAKETGQSSVQAKHAERRRERDAKKAAQAETDKKRETELEPGAKQLCDAHGIGAEQARALSGNPPLLNLFRDAVAQGADAKTAAGLVVTDVARLFKEHSSPTITAQQLSDLARLVQAGDVSARAAKDVLSEMAKTGEAPIAVVERLGLAKVVDPSALAPIIEAVLSQFEAKVADYRAGNQNLFGLFVGQVMQRTGGSADPKMVQQLLREKLVP